MQEIVQREQCSKHLQIIVFGSEQTFEFKYNL